MPIAASAAPITFEFNAGPITYLERAPSTPDAFDGFVLDEDVLVQFSLDDEVRDRARRPNRGIFEDELADIVLTGASSGAMIEMIGVGAYIEVDSRSEIDFNSLFFTSPFDPISFASDESSDIDITFVEPVFSDPNNLATTLAEFIALLDEDGNLTVPNVSKSSSAEVSYFEVFPIEDATPPPFDFPTPGLTPPNLIPGGDICTDPFAFGCDGAEVVAMEFGPVPVAIPVPPALALLGGGLVVLGVRRRKIH